MGLNLKLVIIQGHSKLSPQAIAEKIGIGKIEPLESLVIDQICFPEPGLFAYGKIGNFTILAHHDLSMSLISEELSRVNFNFNNWERSCFQVSHTSVPIYKAQSMVMVFLFMMEKIK